MRPLEGADTRKVVSLAYFLLITGALLFFISCLPALRLLLAGETVAGLPAAPGEEALPGGEPAGEEDLAERLAALQEEVAALTSLLEKLANGGSGTAGAAGTESEKGRKAFPCYLAAALKGEPQERGATPPAGGAALETGASDLWQQIRQAYAAGESLESLARRYGRGKGEIALILNLQR